MIYVYGTSHVSEDSLELVEEKIEEIDPEIVALELDFTRLNSMLSEEEQNGGTVFVRIIKAFQDRIGSKTGVMPGDEMLYAYELSVDKGKDVALIDQDIRTTVEKLKDVRRAEKVKAVAQLLLGMFIPGRINMNDIPEDRFIEQLLEEFRFKFPELYKALIEERNRYMVEALKQLQRENEGEDIVAFVGAGHKRAVRNSLRDFP